MDPVARTTNLSPKAVTYLGLSVEARQKRKVFALARYELSRPTYNSGLYK